MKLFKSLLVAPAALGLLAPMSATANELNLADFTDYSSSKEVKSISEFNSKQLAVTNSRVDGLETRINNFEAGSFSETTTASFSADFAIGSVDGIANNEAVSAGYSFQIDLNSSFTGEDSFDVSIDAGNAGNATNGGSLQAFDELDLNDNGDGLAVDGISYTFPLGDKATVFVGDNVDGSSLYSTACVYGSPTDTMDDCGLASSAIDEGTGTAAGASIELGNGFTAAFGYTGAGSTANGLATNGSLDSYGLQLSYADDSYAASVTYANVETSTTEDTTFWGLNAYWTPDSTGSAPSISVGYEMGDPATGNDTTQYFVGLQWDEVGPGTLGVALGNTGAIADGAEETTMYEVFYNYPVNDGMTITPVIYSKEEAGAANDSDTGIIVKTSFSF